MSTKTNTVIVTTSKMPSLAINSEALKTPSVCLKILQTILGAIALGLSMTEVTGYFRMMTIEMRCQILVIFTFLIATFLLLVSSLVSSMAANMIPKTIFEFLYHLSASVSYLVITMIYTVHFYAFEGDVRNYRTDEAVAISVLGIINGLLYCASTYISFKSYRAS